MRLKYGIYEVSTSDMSKTLKAKLRPEDIERMEVEIDTLKQRGVS